MGVYDGQGILIASNRPELVGQDFSSRDYFTGVRDKPQRAVLYLSAPFRAVGNSADRITSVGRMVLGPDGAFAGVGVAALDPVYFASVSGCFPIDDTTILSSPEYQRKVRTGLGPDGGTLRGASQKPDLPRSIQI